MNEENIPQNIVNPIEHCYESKYCYEGYLSLKTKTHICSQHPLTTLYLFFIFYFVNSSNARTIPMIKIQVTILYTYKNIHLYIVINISV